LHFKKLLTLAQEKKNIKNYTQKKEIDLQKNFMPEIFQGKNYSLSPRIFQGQNYFTNPKPKRKIFSRNSHPNGMALLTLFDPPVKISENYF